MTNNHIWTIIMAGGIGSRLWPMAGTDNPKQFIDVLGTGKTMLQSTFERYAQLCTPDHIVIVTGEAYADRVRQQLPGLQPYQVLGEPLRRGTAPCIAYGASVIRQMDPDAVVVVTPSDHAIFGNDSFLADIRQAIRTVQEHDWIITLGAQPTRPDTSYGYIQRRDRVDGTDNLYRVITFTEKPPIEMARQFIASGEFFWNAGIFVWRMDVLEKAFADYLPRVAEAMLDLGPNATKPHLDEVYAQGESVSVDFGIMEKANNVYVMAASFGWSDVETWGTLYDASPHDANGNTLIGGNIFTYDTHNTVVNVPTGRTVVVEGLDGFVVCSTADTLLICRRSSEEKLFKFSTDVEMQKILKH